MERLAQKSFGTEYDGFCDGVEAHMIASLWRKVREYRQLRNDKMFAYIHDYYVMRFGDAEQKQPTFRRLTRKQHMVLAENAGLDSFRSRSKLQ